MSHSSGGRKSKLGVPVCSGRSLLPVPAGASLPCPHMAEGVRELGGVPVIGGLHPHDLIAPRRGFGGDTIVQAMSMVPQVQSSPLSVVSPSELALTHRRPRSQTFNGKL